MMMTRGMFAATAALCVASCTTNPSPNTGDEFENASRAYAVPVDLLKAIAYVETRWQPVGPSMDTGEFDRPVGAGVFALWGENLTAGAPGAGALQAGGG